jgi:hypothetical protein
MPTHGLSIGWRNDTSLKINCFRTAERAPVNSGNFYISTICEKKPGSISRAFRERIEALTNRIASVRPADDRRII